MLRHEVVVTRVKISTTTLRILTVYLNELGFQDKEILDGVVSLERIYDSDKDITESEYEKIYQKCLSLCNDPFFGLHLGTKITNRQLGVLGYLLLNCDTFGSAVNSFVRYQRALGDGIVFRLEQRNSSLRIYFDIFWGEKFSQQRIETVYSGFKAIAKDLTGKELIYEKILFKYSPRSPFSEYLRILGSIPEAGICNYIEFSSEYLNLPIINSIPDLRVIFETQMSNKMDQDPSFSKKVRREIFRRISKGTDRSVEALSVLFGMSERSFQMKLESENTSFRQVHDEVKLEFAEKYLKEGSSITEIAFALGFSDPSAFQRAFKRLTGKTPGKGR